MTGFTLPTSRPVTQGWGAEFDDWDGDGVVDYPGGFYHSIGWDGHNGIDFGCLIGDTVEAVADGVVTFAGNAGNWHAILSGGGNAILIEHPEYGVQTEYLHLSEWLVQAGETVRRGQVIARSGKTGAATAPHLHLGMLKIRGYNLADRWRGRIDPTPYLYGNLNPDYAAAAVGPQGTITTLSEEDDMGILDEPITREGGGPLNGKETTLRAVIANFDANVHYTREAIKGTVAATVSAIFQTKFYRAGGATGQTDLAATIAYLDANLDKLDAKQIMDPAAIAAAVSEATNAALKDITITLSNAPGAATEGAK